MAAKYRHIELNEGFWERFYLPFPLVIIGSKEGDHYDLAPKHMAMPLSWEHHYGFVCTPAHATYQNIKIYENFTVSYPRPEQLMSISLSASPRSQEDQHKAVINLLETTPAEVIDGVFIKGSFLMLECKLLEIFDYFGKNSLITGTIVNARADENYLIGADKNNQQQLYEHPLLTYLHPGRCATIKETINFPFPKDFKK
jgi:flavin reductase (DIM6/NTAB) family NADH-FMN oxidoreductase RutF